MDDSDSRKWTFEEFGSAKLGDQRRRLRLTRVVRSVAAAPAGRVTQVVTTSAERQGTYDLLANREVTKEALDEARSCACVARCCAGLRDQQRRVLVVLDQSSIATPDHRGTKDFGVVGSYRNGGRGLSVLTALAMDEFGTPYGIVGQRYWARPTTKPPRLRTHSRKTENKETQHALELVGRAIEAFNHEPRVRPCFIGDRGYDAGPLLTRLAQSGVEFIIRSCWNRRLTRIDGDRTYLRAELQRAPVLGTIRLDVAAGYRRKARAAQLSVRSAAVDIELVDRYAKKTRSLRVNAIWVHEVRTVPRGEKPLDWVLLTNLPVATMAQVQTVIALYCRRWGIEEFHKTWKSGACNVEDSRLHSAEALAKWAIILASVAVRIERLKRLSRETPDAPATVELSDGEIRAIIWLKRRRKKRTETIPKSTPSLRDAVRWMAEIGGYTGYGGPPGIQTIGRGYDRISLLAEYMEGAGAKSDE